MYNYNCSAITKLFFEVNVWVIPDFLPKLNTPGVDVFLIRIFDKKKKIYIKELRKKESEKQNRKKEIQTKRGEKGKNVVGAGVLIEKEILNHVLKLISGQPAPVNAFRVT